MHRILMQLLGSSAHSGRDMITEKGEPMNLRADSI